MRQNTSTIAPNLDRNLPAPVSPVLRRSIHLRRKLVTGLLAVGTLTHLMSCGDKSVLDQEQVKRYEEAQTFYKNRKFKEAIERLERLREDRPANIEIGTMLARIYFYTRDFKKSEAVLRELLEEDEHNPYVLLWLGKTLAVDDKRQAEAAAVFRQILARDPENYAAHYYLGRCLEEQSKIKQALLQYQTALSMEFQLSKIHLHMGRLMTRLDMKQRASDHLDRVRLLGVNPGDMSLAAELQQSLGAPAPTAATPAARPAPRGRGR